MGFKIFDLIDDGTAEGYGKNTYLGIFGRNTPTVWKELSTILIDSISCGENHALLLSKFDFDLDQSIFRSRKVVYIRI